VTGGIWTSLRDSARRSPDSLVLLSDQRAVTFGTLAADADVMAGRLISLDIRAGDRVALAAGNTYQWIVAYFAILRAGAVPVLLNTRWSAEELAHALKVTGATVVLFEPQVRTRDIATILTTAVARSSSVDTLVSLGDTAPAGAVLLLDVAPGAREPVAAELDRRIAAVRPADVAEMVFTSGSTGFPKAAVLRHDGVLANVTACTRRLRLGPGDRWCSGLPFFHIGGHVWGLLGCVLRGATLVQLAAFSAEAALTAIERYRCTLHFAVATMMYDELRFGVDRFDVSSLRVCSAGADPELRRAVRAAYRVPTILSMWGLSEAHGNVSLTGPPDTLWVQDNTFGLPHPGTEVVAVGPDTDRRLPPGEEGQLLVRGGCVFNGYYGDATATSASIDDEGWLHTGDTGAVLASGHIVYTGRLGEKIRVGGENVSVTEVEAVLTTHPQVEQCYAVGVPDPRLEEVPIAFVRAERGTAPDVTELRAYASTTLADFKMPRRIVLVDDFPRGAAGRVSKSELRAWGRELWPEPNADNNEVDTWQPVN
jgi:fatty-acyl-CoA synthase